MVSAPDLGGETVFLQASHLLKTRTFSLDCIIRASPSLSLHYLHPLGQATPYFIYVGFAKIPV
jgi:hypothetical protein